MTLIQIEDTTIRFINEARSRKATITVSEKPQSGLRGLAIEFYMCGKDDLLWTRISGHRCDSSQMAEVYEIVTSVWDPFLDRKQVAFEAFQSLILSLKV